MDKDLLVLLEPCVHLTELELDEPVELVIVVDGSGCLRAAVADDNVVDVVLLRLEGVDEELLRDVLCLEEVIGVVWLEPPARPRASGEDTCEPPRTMPETERDLHEECAGGVDDVLPSEEDTDPSG